MLKSVSEQYLEKMQSNLRTFIPRMTVDGVEVDGEIQSGLTINLGSCGSEQFAIGNVYIPYITASIAECSKPLQDKEILLEMGLALDDGTVEYKKVGYFTVEKPATDKFQTSFTAYGRLMKRTGGVFISTLSYPATIQAVLNEVSAQTGLTIRLNGLTTAGEIPTPIVGETHREVLMRIAGLLGGFVTEDGDGNVVISKYALNKAVTVDTDFCYSYPETADMAYTVTGLEVIVREEGTDEEGNTIAGEKYISNSVVNIKMQHPYMTESMFRTCESNIVGFSYMPAKAEFLGDIRLEPWDSIVLTDEDPEAGIDVPCMNITHVWDGGLTTTINAPGQTETEYLSASGGPMSTMVDRVYQKMFVTDKILTGKVSADFVETNYAKIDLANIEEASIKTAMIEDAQITSAKIKDAAITEAKIGDAQIGTAKIKEGAITEATIHDGAVNTAKIADAAITNAKIDSLDAGKIKTGEIETERLILVDNETGKRSVITALNEEAKNQLDGAVITEKTIEAAKISVADLEAFGATIGGFSIDASSIHSKKTAINDPTAGVYISTTGIGVGDGKTHGIQGSPFEVYADGTVKMRGKNGSIVFDPVTGNIDIVATNFSIGSSAVVVSTVFTYQVGTSPTDAPTGEWSPDIPTVNDGEYLWTKTTTTYSDGTTKDDYVVSGSGGAGGDAITMSITTSNGNVLASSDDSTTLTAHVFVNGVEQNIGDDGVCGTYGTVKWYLSGTFVKSAKSLIVTGDKVTDKASYTAQLE